MKKRILNAAHLWPPLMKQINGNVILGGTGSDQPLLQNGKLSKFLRFNAYAIYLRVMSRVREGFCFTTDIAFVEDLYPPKYDKTFSGDCALYIWKDGAEDLLTPLRDRRQGNALQMEMRFRLYECGPLTVSAHFRDFIDEARGTALVSRNAFPLKVGDYRVRPADKTADLMGTVYLDQTSLRSGNNLYHFYHAMTVARRLSREYPYETVTYAVDFAGSKWRQLIVDAMEASFENLRFVPIDKDTEYHVENAIIVSEEIEWLFDFFCRDDDYRDVSRAIGSYLRSRYPGRVDAVSRADSVNVHLIRPTSIRRAISNLEDVQREVEADGFVVVQPELLEYSEQVCGVFGKAGRLLATPGAALANIAFCPPGAQIIAVAERNAIDPFWNIYAEIFGLKYACCHEGVRGTPGGNYLVDPERLSAFLERL